MLKEICNDSSMTARLDKNYFSEALKWIVVSVSILVGSFLIFTGSYEWIIFFLLIISLISFSTRYSMIIDTQKKVIIDSFYFLWIRIQSEEFSFHILKCIRMDKQRHVYTANSRTRDRQADFNEYIGTLEYDQGKSVELIGGMEYLLIAEEMKRIAGQLNLPVERTF